MGTTIVSNGSRFFGEAPGTVADLLRALAAATLDPRFEAHGGRFARRDRATGVWRFHGNFLTVSHVFDVRSDDPAVVGPLRRAIARARDRKAYRDARASRRADSDAGEAKQ